MNLQGHRVKKDVLGNSQKFNRFKNGTIFYPLGFLTLLSDLLIGYNG